MKRGIIYFILAGVLISVILENYYFIGLKIKSLISNSPVQVNTVPSGKPLPPTETPQPVSGDCCPRDKEILNYKCISANCIGVPYPKTGVHVEICASPDQYNHKVYFDPCPLR